MQAVFGMIAFFLSLAALFLASEIIRRLNVHHREVQMLNERLIAAEIKVGELDQARDGNMKMPYRHESRA